MYHTIDYQTEVEDVGPDYPQASCLTQLSAHEIKFSAFPSFKPKLVYELAKGAKLTDVLSQAAIMADGLLISERFKNLLKEFNIMRHKFYPVTLLTKKGEVKYYWLHLVDSTFTNVIDYNNSTFYWTDCTFRQGEIKLSSYKEYQKLKKENGILWGVSIDKIKLNNNFDRRLDLFSCLPLDMGIYISDKLKIKIQEERITGMEINEAVNITPASPRL